MADLHEKLRGLYGKANRESNPSNSWIPKRIANDPFTAFQRTHPVESQLSQVRSEEIFSSQTWPSELTSLVEKMLEIKLNTDDISGQMTNFQTSFIVLSDKYGDLLPPAIDECIAGNVDFLHFTGFIDKDIVKAKIKEIRKRRRRLKHQ